MWIPFACKPKEPCATCGTTSYVSPLMGDCEYTGGLTFCNSTCRITYRWRGKFKIYEPSYDIDKRPKNPRNGKEKK